MLKKAFKNITLCRGRIQTQNFWFRSQLHHQLSKTVSSLMAALAYTSGFCALVDE